MAGCDQAGIGEAGLAGGLGLAIQDSDVMAVAQQLIGGGDADDPGAENNDAHLPTKVPLLSKSLTAIARTR